MQARRRKSVQSVEVGEEVSSVGRSEKVVEDWTEFTIYRTQCKIRRRIYCSQLLRISRTSNLIWVPPEHKALCHCVGYTTMKWVLAAAMVRTTGKEWQRIYEGPSRLLQEYQLLF